jgi:hypothetical protein
MSKEFDWILDNCIDRLHHGDSLQQCLADNQEYADQLEPLLRVYIETSSACAFTPAEDTKRNMRLNLYKEMDKKESSFWKRGKNLIALPLVTGLLIVITLLLLNPQAPETIIDIPPDESIPTGVEIVSAIQTDNDKNFTFLVSDEENAIGDFSSLYITVEKIVLLRSGDSDTLIEFVPSITEFDLTLLQGDNSLELWNGIIPEGKYSKIFVYVSEIKGVLKSTGEEINAKLPSGKLQLATSFQISSANITSFTFDITVVATGNSKHGIRYNLKPQASESKAITRGK